MPRQIQWAAREKRRQVFSAVGRSFLKTITEPLTNADSILKKQAGVSHAAGLVGLMLRLRPNEHLNTADLKKSIAKASRRKIKVEIVTVNRQRLCRVIDTGTGMSAGEIEAKFGTYAAAKAKGEQTRSLFGRGALDVLLCHERSNIYSVKDGVLSSCRIYWSKGERGDAMNDTTELGRATKKLLESQKLPLEIANHGTVVEFALGEATHVPLEDQIISKISGFYMLRLIAADPNSEVEIERTRGDGKHTDILRYDFPLGVVLGRFNETLDLGSFGKLPVDILVARSDVPLETDPENIERRENGLLFVDDNDAVLDLTLLPHYDRSPYLKHIFGIVRISGFRAVLEAKLEADDAEAVLTATRDGFDAKSDITKKLFALVERCVKPIYEKEEKSQKRGNSARSEKLDQRVKEALKAINQFNADETDEDGTGKKAELRPEPIFFSIDSTRLHIGVPRRIQAYVNLDLVKENEIVLFESDRPEIKVEPDSGVVESKKKRTHQRIDVSVSCDVKGLKGTVTALSLDRNGTEIRAELRILGVDDPPLFVPPEDIAFTASRFSGDPNRSSNNAILLVNLTAFTGMPEISFWLEETVGNVTLGEAGDRLNIKVTPEHVIPDQHVARLLIPFRATGWGQNAVLRAKVKRHDGKTAHAKCKLKFERQPGDQKFSNFIYEDLGRPILGDVAGDKLYVNSGYALHKQIFGDTEDDFNKSLETDPIAQVRAVSVLVETAVFHTATTKHQAGGLKGLHIDPDDPIGSLRPYLDESKMKLEPKVYRALASNGAKTEGTAETARPTRSSESEEEV